MLDLTRLSFEDVVNQLKIKLLEKEAWKDAYLASTGTVVIELYAYVLQLLLYYLKRTAEEQFPSTAQFWQSLVKIANVLGLYVKRPRGAEGYVRMRLRQDAEESSKTVSAFTAVYCGEVPLYVVNDVVIYKNSWTEVRVRQGDRKTVSFIAKGTSPVEEFVIRDTTASDVDIVIRVGGNVYEYVNDLFEVLGKPVVKGITLPDKSLCLQFFRAFASLPPSVEVRVEYSSVIEGWLPSADAIWVIEDDDIELDVNIRTFVSGGRWETVEELRSRFINYFGTGKRVVTKEDLEKIVLSVEGVEKVRVVDVKERFKAPFGGAYVYVKPVGGYEMGEVLKERIEEVLSKLSLVGVKVFCLSVQKVDVDIYLIVKGKIGVSADVLREEIVSLLNELYDKAQIGEWIYREEIISWLRQNGIDVVKLVVPDKDLVLFDNQIVVLRTVRVDVVR